ncbi:MAG: hypothetical protein ABUL46_00495 [Chitinophaga rupis]
MKKSILIGIVMLITGLINSYAAGEDSVNKFIASAFLKKFAAAREVKWEKLNNGMRACFKIDEQILYAYYSGEGELTAVARPIRSSQLPLNLSLDLNQKYSEYYIADIFEVSSDNSSSYFVVLDSPRRKLLLKSIGSEGFIQLP